MEYGFSRDLFLQWAGNANNSIIITSRTSPGTLARDLIELKNKTLTLEVKKRVRLEGAELEEYQKKEREKKMLKENMSVELSSDSEDEAMNVIKGKHDLLIKPLYKQQSFFKSSKKHFPMYPFFEEKVKWDDYGEFLKDEECKIVDVLNYGEDKDMYDSKDDDIPDPTEVPSKCISFTRTINVEAQIQFIDFEGRSDGESIKKIISNVKPRRLIFIRGSPESTNAAVDYAVKYMDSKVYAPQYGEIIDVTSETHIYQVRLTDAMASSLIFKKGKDVELAWIDARIVYDHKRKEPVEINNAENESNTTNQNSVNNEPVAEVEEQFEDVYKLEPLPVNQITGHQPTFINELKLSDFKQVLSKCNIPTEISGGVLYCCNGTVAVRRIESGKIILEGCLSEDYYKIRDLLYEQYAII